MKQVYKYDDSGEFIEPVFIGDDELFPANCTEKPLPQPNWKPVFDKVKKIWVETITQAELDELKNHPQAKTEIELLREENAQLNLSIIDLYEMIMG